MNAQIFSTIITSVLGGMGGGILNYLFTRRKTEAEIEKLEEKTVNVRSEVQHALGEATYNDATKANEVVLYDCTKGINGCDLISKSDRYNLQQGMVLIQSDDWVGYELQTYICDGKKSNFIPKNETISGYRKFHVSCELKVINAKYDIYIFLWETPEPEYGDPSIGDRPVTVANFVWVKTDFYFMTPPDKNYVVNIGAERFSGRGSLQIRSLVVTERVD